MMVAAVAKSLQSCLTRCDPIDGSPPGLSSHGISLARVLEWCAIAFSEKYLKGTEIRQNHLSHKLFRIAIVRTPRLI